MRSLSSGLNDFHIAHPAVVTTNSQQLSFQPARCALTHSVQFATESFYIQNYFTKSKAAGDPGSSDSWRWVPLPVQLSLWALCLIATVVQLHKQRCASAQQKRPWSNQDETSSAACPNHKSVTLPEEVARREPALKLTGSSSLPLLPQGLLQPRWACWGNAEMSTFHYEKLWPHPSEWRLSQPLSGCWVKLRISEHPSRGHSEKAAWISGWQWEVNWGKSERSQKRWSNLKDYRCYYQAFRRTSMHREELLKLD